MIVQRWWQGMREWEFELFFTLIRLIPCAQAVEMSVTNNSLIIVSMIHRYYAWVLSLLVPRFFSLFFGTFFFWLTLDPKSENAFNDNKGKKGAGVIAPCYRAHELPIVKERLKI